MKKILILILIVSLGLNFTLFYLFTTNVDQKKTKTEAFRLVNPLNNSVPIDSNFQESRAILHYTNLRPNIEAEIHKYEAEDGVGIFLQDIKTGSWMGINEKKGFVPASLLKIPIAMATLKKVDRNEVKLSDSIELIASDLDEEAGNLYQRGEGAKLTIWEAIKIMILTSDNTAKNALKRQLSDIEIDAVFTHVGIPNPYQLQNGQVVSPRGYSRVFKALYFSTFISPDLSEKLLDLATDTQMEKLISAGIPAEIQVSHKYGERPDGISDCGIVYHPINPYFLCIMVKEMEIPEAQILIRDISNLIYLFVSKN